MLTTLLSVALGGAIGASGRYLVNFGVLRALGPGFPFATMIANIVGSFAMGVIVVVLARKSGGNALAPFLMTGVLGGFTTFSAFSLDAMTLYERGNLTLAALYIGFTVVLSLFAIFLGMYATRAFLTL